VFRLSRVSFGSQIWLSIGNPSHRAVASSPAYIAIEIASPDDRRGRLKERLEDYRRWGVPHVWLVDPQRKCLYEYTEAGLLQHPSLKLPEFDFEISSEELFKDI
jgi:Uma2 family endonuclease